MKKNTVINILIIQAFLLIFFSVQYYQSHNKMQVMNELLKEQERALTEIEFKNKNLKNEIIEMKLISKDFQKNLENVIKQNGLLAKRNEELSTEMTNMILVESTDKDFTEKMKEYNNQMFMEYSERQTYNFDQ